MIVKSTFHKFYFAARTRFGLQYVPLSIPSLHTHVPSYTFAKRSPFIPCEDDMNRENFILKEQNLKENAKLSSKELLINATKDNATKDNAELNNLLKSEERSFNSEISKITQFSSLLMQIKSSQGRKFNFSKRDAEQLSNFLKNEIDGAIIWLIANVPNEITSAHYIQILRNLHQASLIEDLIASIKHLQFAIHKETFALHSIKDLIIILEICDNLQKNKMFYSSKILLYNLEYTLSRKLLLDASQHDIVRVLELYSSQISSCSYKEVQRFYLKTLNKFEVIFTELFTKENEEPFQQKKSMNLMFQILNFFSKARYYSPAFYRLIETELVNILLKNKYFEMKTWLIAFEKISWQNGGDHLLQYLRDMHITHLMDVEGKFKRYDDKYLIQLAFNITLFEIELVYEAMMSQAKEVQGRPDFNMKLITSKDFQEVLEESRGSLASNDLVFKLIENSFQGSLDHFIKENLGAPYPYWAYMMLYWQQYTRGKKTFKNQDIAQLFETSLNLIQDWRYWFRKDKDHNDFSNDVINILSKNHIQHQLEHKIHIRKSDICIPEHKIAIELDGSYHYFVNEPSISRVGSKLRNIYLMTNGWKVLEFNHLLWEKLSVLKTTDKFITSNIETLKEYDEGVILQESEYAQ